MCIQRFFVALNIAVALLVAAAVDHKHATPIEPRTPRPHVELDLGDFLVSASMMKLGEWATVELWGLRRHGDRPFMNIPLRVKLPNEYRPRAVMPDMDAACNYCIILRDGGTLADSAIMCIRSEYGGVYLVLSDINGDLLNSSAISDDRTVDITSCHVDYSTA